MKPWIRNSLLSVAVGGCVWGIAIGLGEESPVAPEGKTKQQTMRAENPLEEERPAQASAAPLSSASSTSGGDAIPDPSVNTASVGLPLDAELSELRTFWIRSADAGGPQEAIDRLEGFARAHIDDERLASAALDMREDLIGVRERRNDWLIPKAESGAVWNPETGEGTPPERGEDWVPPDWIDLDRYELISETIRYGSDDRAILSGVQELAYYREDMVAQTLLEVVDHPSADIRKTATQALWRSAAEGIEVDATKDRLYYLARDSDERVSRLAEQALADLEQLEKRADQAAAEPQATFVPPEEEQDLL
ncbi:MAG: hypothetical protein VX252_17250 [Myxococcota bacterium]|nr:hypothetical protein [Myxococcota bacterium]